MFKAFILSSSDSVGLFQFTLKTKQTNPEKLPKPAQNKHSPITFLGTWTHSIKSLPFDITTVIALKLFTEVGFLDETQQNALERFLDETQQSVKGALECFPHPEVHKIHKTKNRSLGIWEMLHKTLLTY